MKRLVLMRHGRSPFDGKADHDRRLDDRGRAAAAAVARSLAAAGFRPDLLLASGARRTAETAAIVARELGPAASRSLDELYLATAAMIRTIIEREADASVQSVLVVGHNPGLGDLGSLIDPQGIGLAPADAADLELDVDDWRLLGEAPLLARRLHRA